MEPVYFSSFLCQDYQQMLNCMKLFKATLAEMFIHKMQSSFHLQEHKIFHKESIVLDNLYTITDFKDQKCFIFFCKFSIIKTPNKINIMNMFLFKQIIVTPLFFFGLPFKQKNDCVNYFTIDKIFILYSFISYTWN